MVFLFTLYPFRFCPLQGRVIHFRWDEKKTDAPPPPFGGVKFAVCRRAKGKCVFGAQKNSGEEGPVEEGGGGG